MLFPSCLHLQSQSSNFNSHYTQSRFLSEQLVCGESLLLLLLSVLYTATTTILLKTNQIMLFSGVKNFQWHSVMFGIKNQMLSMPIRLYLDQWRFLDWSLQSQGQPSFSLCFIFTSFSSSHVTNSSLPQGLCTCSPSYSSHSSCHSTPPPLSVIA